MNFSFMAWRDFQYFRLNSSLDCCDTWHDTKEEIRNPEDFVLSKYWLCRSYYRYFLHIKNFEDDWLDFLRDIGPEDIWGHSSVKETFLLLHIRRTNDVTRMGEEEEGSQPW